MTEAEIEALADYLISQGLAEQLPGYGHATGRQVAEGVAAWLSATRFVRESAIIQEEEDDEGVLGND